MENPSLSKIAYQTLQGGKSLAGLAHKELSSKIMELIAPGAMPSPEEMPDDLVKEIRLSMTRLASLDWEEAERNVYPKALLFQAPWVEWFSKYPLIWLDLPSTWERRKGNKTREIPKEINSDIYPNYYLQNFHHQTDGYLSDYSASLYDLQVEILFNGTADLMRRRILKPLKRSLKVFEEPINKSIKVLDIATGTGRTLKQIRAALPYVELLGIDLSEAYLRKACKTLNRSNHNLVQLIRGNAEKLPFSDGTMNAVTCVFLLHELPPKARQNVLNECWRVLDKNGSLILADSIQLTDSPKFISLMENFHQTFHEPYYKDYINDDIESRLKESGFTLVEAKSHFMTRVWAAKKT